MQLQSHLNKRPVGRLLRLPFRHGPGELAPDALRVVREERVLLRLLRARSSSSCIAFADDADAADAADGKRLGRCLAGLLLPRLHAPALVGPRLRDTLRVRERQRRPPVVRVGLEARQEGPGRIGERVGRGQEGRGDGRVAGRCCRQGDLGEGGGPPGVGGEVGRHFALRYEKERRRERERVEERAIGIESLSLFFPSSSKKRKKKK